MKSKYFKIICLSALLASSCKKFVEIDPAINIIEASEAFKTDALVKADIAGMHSNAFISQSFFDTDVHRLTGFSADEITYYDLSFDRFSNNQLNVNNSYVENVWNSLYRIIYQSNFMIEELDKSTKVSPSVKAEAYGTAKFFRAWSYLFLTSFYGDVPLALTSDVRITSALPRTPKNEVYTQIIADLLAAKAAFKGINISSAFVNEKSATAILARAYLYNKQWQDAANAATELINGPLTGTLKLEDVPNKFLRTSKETILAISSNGSNTSLPNFTYLGAIYIPLYSTSNYNITPSLLNAFEPGDLRKENWVNTFTDNNGITTSYPFKYKLNDEPSNASLAEDQVLIRLSEMVLIRAEALAQLEKPSDAVNDINAIREKAGLMALPKTLTKEQVLLAIEQERRVEFFTEGHRWFDLIRTGRADAVLGALKGSKWKSTATLYPIPDNEFKLNPNLKNQNPGYNN